MKVLHHGGRFGNTKENIKSGFGFYPMLNFQLGSTHNLAGSKIWHTHTCSLCIRKYISYQRQKFNSALWILDHFLRNFSTTFGGHPNRVFPPQIPLQKWQVFHFRKHSTFLHFFHVFLWYPLAITRKNEGKKKKKPQFFILGNALQVGYSWNKPPFSFSSTLGKCFFQECPAPLYLPWPLSHDNE